MKYHPVNIYHNGDVDNELVNVSRDDRDVVIWQNPHPYDFTVSFTKSPFEDGSTFTVPSRGAKSSGPLKTSVQAGDVYPYDISSLELQMSADPGIKIKP